jgi:hypothetical protein
MPLANNFDIAIFFAPDAFGDFFVGKIAALSTAGS